MAGSFPGFPLVQQFDVNGNPLSGCLLYVYNGGTTTPASVYQDIGLTLSAPWPLQADQSGRIPLFFVGDGNYHLRLTDSAGVVQYDAAIVPSIGPSSTGSSGGAVDPTTVFSTGDVKWQPIAGTLSGWVRCNGRTIGSATSGPSEYANSGAQNLFTFLWNNFSDGTCPVVGGRGASALADWNANKQITLLDFRGYLLGGLSDMGSIDSARWSGTTFSRGNGTTAASLLGETTHTLLSTEMLIHTHTATLTLPSANLTGAPSLSLPSASLSGTPSLVLPGASFAGTTVTPTFTGTLATITVTGDENMAFGNSTSVLGGNTNPVTVGQVYSSGRTAHTTYTPAVVSVPNGIATLKNRTLSPVAQLVIGIAREVAKRLKQGA